MLNIKKTVENSRAIVALAGRLDTAAAPELDSELKDMLPDLTALTLDMKELDYVSSAGLRVLLSAYKVMSRQGELKLKNVNEVIMEILEVTGFSDIFTIE
ncbi:MAG: STAS domain-containing protein [Oscillospiraceae bacterium]|nr:STAS domain-containing protein [Oscillospiraceae bacterium]